MKTKIQQWQKVVVQVILSATLLAAPAAKAADFVWNGSIGTWGTAGNWNPIGVPGSVDNAFITNGTCTVTLTANIIVGSVTVGGPSGTQTLNLDKFNLTLNGASVVGANGHIDMPNNCAIAGAGNLTVNGTLNFANGAINAGGAITIGSGGVLSSGPLNVTLARTVNNGGTTIFNGARLAMSAGTIFNNLAGGTLDIIADGALTGTSGTINNSGLVRQSGGLAGTTIAPQFNNSGIVQVQTQTLSLGGGGTHSGTFSNAPSATLALTGGSHSMTSSSLVTGAGVVALSGGATTLTASGTFDVGSTLSVTAGTVTLSPGCVVSGATLNINTGILNYNTAGSVNKVNLNGGTLAGTSPVTVTGSLTLGGGTVLNPFVTANGGLNITGGVTLNGGKLINSGIATWSAGNFIGANGAVFSNLFGATFINSFDGNAISGAGATPTFVNAGLFQKTDGTAALGATAIDFNFINTGTVEVRTNDLSYSFNQQTAGLTLLDGGGLISQAGNSIQLLGGTLMGPGVITIAHLQILSNSAAISPGLPFGQLFITNNYVQTSFGSLDIEIGGVTPGINYDVLSVFTGTATLGGTLNVTLTNGFTPALGTTFTVVTSDTARIGTFATFNYPSNDIGMTVSYDATSATVTVSNLKPVVANPIVSPAAVNYGSPFAFTFPANTFSDPNSDLLTYTAFGMPSGVTFTSGTRAFSGTPTQAGSFPVAVVATDNGTPNLSVTNIFTITVTPAPLTITATPQSKTYGTALALGTSAFTATGLKNGETVGSVTLNSSGAAATAAAGPYLITPSAATGGTFTASNYTITYATGTLTVSSATLTVTANAKSKTFGSILTLNGATDFTPSGLQNGDSIGSVTLLAGGTAATAAVGPYVITPSAATGGTFTAANYAITYATGTLTVNPAALTVTASARTKTYGAALVLGTSAFTTTGLQNGETVGAVTLTASGTPAGTAATAAAGAYTITPSAATGGTFIAANYAITYATGTLTVNPAALTVTASAKSKTYGSTLVFNGATDFTSTGLQNSETIGSVTLAASGTPAGTAATAAAGAYTITPSAATGGSFTAANYAITYATGTLTVNPAALTVTATAKSKTYGTNLALNGAADFTSAGLQNGDSIGSVTLAASGTPAGTAATAAAGAYTITPSAATGGTFSAANYAITYATGTLTVNPAALTITATAQNKTYGTTFSLGTTAFTTTGLQNSETVGSVTLNSIGAAATAAVGAYNITPSAATGGTFAAANYAITYATGTLTVNPAALTIAATPKTKTYGSTLALNGATDFISAGLQNSETIGSVTLSVSGTPAGTAATAGVATYTITPSAATGGTFSVANYTITYSTGALTVNPAALTVTATANSKTYGSILALNGATDFTSTGSQNGETIGSVTLTASGTPAGTAATAAAGAYAITPSAATGGTFTAANYAITYATGTLTVNPAALTVTASARTKTYGAALVLGTSAFTTTGLQNADTVGAVTLTASGTPAGTAANAAAGGYTITPSAATGGTFTAANYAITYATGTLTVNPAALTVTASAKSKTYGSTLVFNGATDFTSTGLQNSETIGSVTLAASGTPAGTAATAAAGAYTITPSAAIGGTFTAANYAITYATGTLTVNPAALTVTATAKSKTYGSILALNGATDFTSAGLQNSDTIGSVTLAASGTPAGTAATAAAGAYTITPSAATGGSFTAANYAITYTTGTLTVNPAALTVTATAKSKTYGSILALNGATDFTSAGLQNSDTIGSVTLAASGTPAGTAATAAAGAYTITPSAATGGTFSAANYAITYATGTLTVNPAALTVTATARSKTYGTVLALGTSAFTTTGLQNGETVGAVTLTASGTPAGTAATAAAGTYSITPSAATGGAFTAANYAITYVTGTLTVNPAALTVLAADATRAYGQTNPVFTASYIGFVNGQTNTVLGGTLVLSTLADTNSPVGTYAITGSGLTATDYSITYSNGTLAVLPHALTVTAQDAAKTYGAADPGFTASYAGFVNGETPTALGGTLVFSRLAGANAGTYPITPSGLTSTNYAIAFVNGTLTINKAGLTITANNQTKAYGAALPTLTVSYAGLVNGDTAASLTTPPAISTIGTASSAVGTYPITASGAADANYTISYVAGTLTVTSVPLTITANNQTKAYGAALPTLTVSYAGLVNGDTAASLTTPPAISTIGTASSAVGTYPITVSGAVDANYTISYAAGTLTVTAVPLTITANNQTKAYGAALPTLTVSYAGLVNGDTAASLTTPPAISTIGTASSAVGTYPITVSGAVDANYTISYAAGTLTVTSVPLTITANNQTKVYGAALPTLTVGYTGFVNGDTAASLTAPPAISTTATASSAAGTYPITASGAVDANYAISYVSGTLTVTKAGLTVVATDASRAYGQTNPVFTATYIGFINGETNTVLGGTLVLSTLADTNSPVGAYAITGSGLTATDYSITYSNGTLAVLPHALTVTAQDAAKTYGAADPGFTASYAGFVNGETPTALGGTLVFSRLAGANAGTYPITPSGLTSTNYAITFVNGTLTIDPKAATVVADAKSKVYGAANPLLTATATGAINGDTLAYTLACAATVTTGVGTSPITVTLGSNPNYNVTPTDALLTITAKAATVVADAKSKVYGTANPLLTATVTGAVNGDTLAYTLACAATATTGVGTSPIAVTLGSNPNYNVTPTDALLTITAKAATVVADAKSKVYGAANPLLTATVTGAVNGDTLAYTLACAATVTTGVGTSPITVTLGSNPNYNVTPTDALLTITAKAATVVADVKSKVYGAANPLLTATVTGAVNGDTLAYTLACAATVTTGVGTSPITVTLGSNPNYNVTPTDALLTITAKAATVVADAKSKVYGAANPLLTATATGAVNGDTLAYTLACAATVTTGVGTSPITVTLGSNPNYNVTKTDALLTVNPAALAVLAADATRAYGQTNPVFTASYIGFVNGQTNTDLGGALLFSTTAETNSPVGTYPIIPSGLAANNYSITYSNGTLTVLSHALTITAQDAAKTYGAADPGFTASYAGFVNGETQTALGGTLVFSRLAGANAGTYPITPSGLTSTNYAITFVNGTLTIDPKAATVVADAKSKVYGAANPLLTATVTGAINGDTLAYTLACAATVTTGVGTSPITVTLGSNPNYNVTPTDGLLTITAKAATVVADAKSKVYGAANPLLTATVTGAVNGDTLAYTLACAATVTTGVGTSPITVTLGSNPNYNVTPTDGLLTITAKAATVVADAKSKVYGTANPLLTATVTGAVNGDTLAYTLACAATVTTGVGTSPIAVTLGSNPNYNVTPTDALLTITAKAATVVADAKSKVYGTANPLLTATVTGAVNGDTLAYTLACAATVTTGVGTSPITVTLGSNPNYNVTPTDALLTITAKAATVVADAKSKVYGAANPLLTATVSGTINGDTLAYTLACAATITTGVGTSPITVTLGSNPNYNVTKTDALLTVNPAALAVLAADATRAYGQTNPVFTASYIGFVNGQTNTDLGGTLLFSTTAETNSPVGTYPIIPSGLAANNYSITYSNGTLTVLSHALTITAQDAAKTYGAADPAFTVSYSGFLSGDTSAVLDGTLAFSRATGENVGTYAIAPSGLTSTNYAITFVNGTLTIDPKAATVVADAKSKVYGAANPLLTATVTGAINGDTLAYTLACAATVTTGVGTSPITVTLGSNPNYNVTPTDGLLTITAKAATVVADAKSKVYGAANPLLTATVTGAVNGDTLAYTLACAATVTTGVGTSPITVTLGSNPNYNVTPTDGLLTITAKAATVVADAKSKVYGTANPLLTATVTGAVNGDTLAYTLACAATVTTGVGTSPIAVTLGSNPNYNVTPTDALLTITAKAATVVADAKSKVYGTANPLLTATVTGAVNGDTLAYTLACAATVTTGVGTSPITVTLGSNPNYNVTPTDALLTITAKAATVVADAKSKVYGAANPLLTATVSGTINGDTLAYTLACAATITTGVGTSPITVTLGSNPNYNVTKTDALLTVNPAALAVLAADATRAYGQTNPVFTASYIGFVNGQTNTDLGGTLLFSTTAETNSPVGTYPIIPSGLAANNYSITYSNGTLTVLSHALTITAQDAAKTYGAADPAFTVSYSGFLSGDTSAVLDGTLAFSRATGENVGTYAIAPSGLTSTNYAITFVNGTLTIDPKAATVVADAKSKVYGTANPLLTATATGAVNGDTLAYTLACAATVTTGVGTSPITVTLGSNPNYNVTPTDALLTITAKAATVVADAKSKVYGTANPLLTATATGAVNGDTLAYTLACAATVTTGVGTSPITVTLGSNPNYNVTPTDALLTITAKAATVVADAKSKVYGTANPLLTATATGAVNGDTLAYTLACAATVTTGVGTSPITVTLGSNPNYNVTPTDALLTITAKAATVVADAKSKVYGAANPLLTATATGAVNGDTLAYTLACAATVTTGVGTSPITVTLGSNPNYNVTKTDALLTVNPAALSITADNKTKTVGAADPAFTVTYIGFVNGETTNVLGGSLVITRVAGEAVGSYLITPSGLTSANYTIAFNTGTLTITPATTAPVIFPLTGAGTPNVVITWSAISNVTYRVQYSPDLRANNWTDLVGDVTATGATASKSDIRTTANRFYRVQVLP